jgi:hypothetical protein
LILSFRDDDDHPDDDGGLDNITIIKKRRMAKAMIMPIRGNSDDEMMMV